MELAILGMLLALGAFGVYRMSEEGGGAAPIPMVKLGKVAVIGDSLAVGLKKQLVHRAELDEVPIDYQAKGGTTTKQWLSSLPNLHGVDVFVVVLGTNDAGGSAVSFRDNMDTILQHAAHASVPVVWVQPTGTHLKGYDRVMAELEAALADGDIEVIIERPTEGYGKDNIHLSPGAYLKWADRIWDTLNGGEEYGSINRHS